MLGWWLKRLQKDLKVAFPMLYYENIIYLHQTSGLSSRLARIFSSSSKWLKWELYIRFDVQISKEGACFNTNRIINFFLTRECIHCKKPVFKAGGCRLTIEKQFKKRKQVHCWWSSNKIWFDCYSMFDSG